MYIDCFWWVDEFWRDSRIVREYHFTRGYHFSIDIVYCLVTWHSGGTKSPGEMVPKGTILLGVPSHRDSVIVYQLPRPFYLQMKRPEHKVIISMHWTGFFLFQCANAGVNTTWAKGGVMLLNGLNKLTVDISPILLSVLLNPCPRTS